MARERKCRNWRYVRSSSLSLRARDRPERSGRLCPWNCREWRDSAMRILFVQDRQGGRRRSRRSRTTGPWRCMILWTNGRARSGGTQRRFSFFRFDRRLGLQRGQDAVTLVGGQNRVNVEIGNVVLRRRRWTTGLAPVNAGRALNPRRARGGCARAVVACRLLRHGVVDGPPACRGAVPLGHRGQSQSTLFRRALETHACGIALSDDGSTPLRRGSLTPQRAPSLSLEDPEPVDACCPFNRTTSDWSWSSKSRQCLRSPSSSSSALELMELRLLREDEAVRARLEDDDDE